MNNQLTELVFIIDKSGSMSGLERDTIGGFNSMLQQQQAEIGEANITTVLFSDDYQLLHDRINVKGIEPLEAKDYRVGGGTALLDAVGKTIKKILKVQEQTIKEYRADNVLFVIITDGEENSSKKYSAPEIKQKIKSLQEKYGWQFMFLGANIDVVEEASKIGIDRQSTMSFTADSEGTRYAFESITGKSSAVRSGKVMNPFWK